MLNTTVRFKEKDYDDLKECSKLLNVSITNIITLAIFEYFANKKT